MNDLEEYLEKEQLNLTQKQKDKLQKSAQYNSYLLNKRIKEFKDKIKR